MENIHRILLIDDDEITNYMNKRVLTKAEIAQQIDIVTDGQAALTYLAGPDNLQSPLPLDLILVDIKMSGMDGFDFLEHYQHLPDDQRACKLFVLSSSASFYDLHRLKEFKEVDGNLSKPLTHSDAVHLIKEHFGAGQTDSPEAQPDDDTDGF